MKILMLLEHHYPPDIRVEKEIKSLLKAGYEVVLACSTLKGKDEMIRDGKFSLIRKRMSSFIHKSGVGCLKFPFYFNFWDKFLQELLRQDKFDLIHLHDLPLSRTVLKYCRLSGIPFLLDSHENYPYMLEAAAHTNTFWGKLLSSNRQWLEYEKQMVSRADALLSIVEEQMQRFVEMGVAEEKIFLVSNTPEPDIIAESEPLQDRFVFVYAGNIYASKGLDVMIEGFRRASAAMPQLRLWIIGNSKKWEKKSESLELGRDNKIKLFGWQPLPELYRIVKSSDAALLPHIKNRNSDYGMPNKLFQYMMAGKPVIASNCVPIVRVLNETGAGITYRDDDAIELAEKMLWLCNNPREAMNMGRKGEEAVKTKYNWQREEKQLLKAYESLLAKHLLKTPEHN